MNKLVNKRLGEILVQLGVLKEEQVEKTLALQKETETKVLMGELLIKSQFAREEDIIRGLKTQYQFTYFPLSRYSIERELIDAFPYETAVRHSAIPVNKLGDILTVAMVNPLDKEAIKEIEEVSKCKVRILISTPTEIKNMIEECYIKQNTPVAEEFNQELTFEKFASTVETEASVNDSELLLRKYYTASSYKDHRNEYENFLNEAKELLLHCYYYSCIAMCCLSAEHAIRNILRNSVLGKKSYVTVNSEEDKAIDALPLTLIGEFLLEQELINETALANFKDLVKLRKKYFQTYARPSERAAHLSIELLENIIRATEQKSRV